MFDKVFWQGIFSQEAKVNNSHLFQQVGNLLFSIHQCVDQQTPTVRTEGHAHQTVNVFLDAVLQSTKKNRFMVKGCLEMNVQILKFFKVLRHLHHQIAWDLTKFVHPFPLHTGRVYSSIHLLIMITYISVTTLESYRNQSVFKFLYLVR